jgi:hypothetical protein
VDFENRDYYFNRVYIEDFSLNDIVMTETHAMLIGIDEHIIIEHSIYNQFV